MPTKRPGQNIKLNGVDDLFKPSKLAQQDAEETTVPVTQTSPEAETASAGSNKYLGTKSGRGFRASERRGVPRTFYLENHFSNAIDHISHTTGDKATKVMNTLLENLAELDSDFAEIVNKFKE